MMATTVIMMTMMIIILPFGLYVLFSQFRPRGTVLWGYLTISWFEMGKQTKQTEKVYLGKTFCSQST